MDEYIEMEHSLSAVSEERFKEIDYEVMGVAYHVQNQHGRLFNEKIYENLMADACKEHGAFQQVRTQVPVKISFRGFEKIYYLDFVINDSVIYEMKTVDCFSDAHQNQLLNYLFLTDLRYGKLINFRSESVEGKFVSTSISKENRYQYSLNMDRWKLVNHRSEWLQEMVIDLINAWGLFLDINLYASAIEHLFERRFTESLFQMKEIRKGNGRLLGKQGIFMIDSDTGFKFTSIQNDLDQYRNHLQYLSDMMGLNALHWINIHQHDLRFETLDMTE